MRLKLNFMVLFLQNGEHIERLPDISLFQALRYSGEDAKVKRTRKVGGAKKRKRKGVSSRFIFVFALVNSAGPTISEPETGYPDIHNNIRCLHFFKIVISAKRFLNL